MTKRHTGFLLKEEGMPFAQKLCVAMCSPQLMDERKSLKPAKPASVWGLGGPKPGKLVHLQSKHLIFSNKEVFTSTEYTPKHLDSTSDYDIYLYCNLVD